jgi:hypothetical protein
MTPIREALVLPCLFLTVALFGGMRLADSVRLVPPPLVSLVLAMLLIAALVRSAVVRPEQLMSGRRTTLENVSGFVLLATLFAATAQIFNLVVPDGGLLHLLVSVFFVVQLLTTLTAVHGRLPMLRSLTVLLGCAFILRYIALESLYAPGRGLVKRLMTALMEGITLGALEYQPAGAVTGYVAFLTLTLYVVGLFLIGLPPDSRGANNLPVVRTSSSSMAVPIILLPLLLVASGCRDRHDEPGSASQNGVLTTNAHREAVLSAARVWIPPSVPISAARLGDNNEEPWPYRAMDEVSCRFALEPVRGTTPKFNCELPGGEIVKVKYGTRNPELFAEVAATRLLAALGFGADQMYLVSRVRCVGCPAMPFPALRCHARTGFGTACFLGGPDYSRAVAFEPAVLERRADGRRIEAVANQGWAWYELDRIDPARGGSPRSHVDAMRLMAVILAHWDNKAENQRLVCRDSPTGARDACAAALALMQDLGATFGPSKVDLPNWRRVAVWKDARTCRVSMEQLPFGGATFPEQRVSEQGRLFLLGLLDQLSPSQLEELFSSSGLTRTDAVTGEGRDPGEWVSAFRDKVRQVREAGPCPEA